MAGRIVLTAGLWFRACPLEGAINPGLSGPGCVSSPLNELILNATEKKGKCKREKRRRRRERESDYLIHPPPEAHTPFQPASQFRTVAGKKKRGRSRNSETVTGDKPSAARPPRLSFQQEGNTDHIHNLPFHTAFGLSHPSNFSSQLPPFISPQEK